jgi:hypothetical protein
MLRAIISRDSHSSSSDTNKDRRNSRGVGKSEGRAETRVNRGNGKYWLASDRSARPFLGCDKHTRNSPPTVTPSLAKIGITVSIATAGNDSIGHAALTSSDRCVIGQDILTHSAYHQSVGAAADVLLHLRVGAGLIVGIIILTLIADMAIRPLKKSELNVRISAAGLGVRCVCRAVCGICIITAADCAHRLIT